jgi:HK97 family phage prohead protease
MTTAATSEALPVLIVWKFHSATPKPAGEGLTTWVLTSGAIDRDGERVYAPGVDVSEFLKNPVALLSHDAHALPIGRWENVRLEGNGWNARLLADLRLAPVGVTAQADQARGLIEARILGACSIGFQSVERGRGPDGTVDHLRTLLMEVSVCSIGSNPESLRVASFSRRAPGEQIVTVDPATVVATIKAAMRETVADAIAKAKGALAVDDDWRRQEERRAKAATARAPEFVSRVAERSEKLAPAAELAPDPLAAALELQAGLPAGLLTWR